VAPARRVVLGGLASLGAWLLLRQMVVSRAHPR